MGEYAPKAIKDMWPIIRDAYSSGQFSGILSGGQYGYHVSRNRLKRIGKSGDYSIQAAIDKLGDGDAGSGIDISLNDAEMKIATRRLMDACERNDPRVVGRMREFFGTLNGRTVTGYSPYRKRRVSADSSHLWHIHISIHRKWCNDDDVCRGIAEVMAGIPLSGSTPKPKPWDGKSYPGANAFVLGERHDAVTLLGQMLVKAGYGRFYSEGPGPLFTEADREAVKAFQEAQGWAGVDADGYPGPSTWALLQDAGKAPSSPAPKPESEEDLLNEKNWKPNLYTGKPQSAGKAEHWQYLRVTDQNNISLTAGPAAVSGWLYVRAELAKGKTIQVRVVEDDVKDGKASRVKTHEARIFIKGDGGLVYNTDPIPIGAIGDAKDSKATRYLRLQWKSDDPKAVITYAHAGVYSTGK